MSYNQVPAGKDLPNDIFVVVEIPANHTAIKYEVEKDYDCLMVDRFMTTPMFYPANYGYINNTLSDDGDPLDVLLITPQPVTPGAVVRARPIGILNMTDEAGQDAKLLAVPHHKLTSAYDHIEAYTDLSELLIQQIKHFFQHYKDLETAKWVKIEGWAGLDAARREIEKAAAAYKAERITIKKR